MATVKMGMTIEEAAECSGIGRNTMRKLGEWRKLPVQSGRRPGGALRMDSAGKRPRRLRAKYTHRTNLRFVLCVFRPAGGCRRWRGGAV